MPAPSTRAASTSGGGVPCTTATFAEHLDVAATAGWRTNLGHDSSAMRTFALAPGASTP